MVKRTYRFGLTRRLVEISQTRYAYNLGRPRRTRSASSLRETAQQALGVQVDNLILLHEFAVYHSCVDRRDDIWIIITS